MPATTRPESRSDTQLPSRCAPAIVDRQIADTAIGAHAPTSATSISRIPDCRTPVPTSLYTPEQRARRDGTRWTMVQGILAPLQFLAFVVSAWLVVRYLQSGEGAALATASVLLKTALLYTIMVTGCIWERVVFGQYLFAPAFFWEDAVSMVVIALHTLYLGLFLTGLGSLDLQFKVALLAYTLYAINAAQFIWKLRQARLAGVTTAQPTTTNRITEPAAESVA